MDIDPISINLYRYRFPDLLLERENRTALPLSQPKPEDTLITHIFTSHSNARSIIPAPQGVGEAKHTYSKSVQNPYAQTAEKPLEQVNQKDDSWFIESAFKYTVGSNYYKPPLETREKMESEVRRCKKAGLPCPHADNNFHCSALFIRCGDRNQFASPETLEQRNMPHTCLYRPKKTGKYIVIIDENEAIRDFCKNSIEIFLNYSSEYIITGTSGFEAAEILNKLKTEAKQCGLLICDANLSGITGFDIVNQLFERNYNTDVMLFKKQSEMLNQPQEFKGLNEIIDNKTIVKKIISKPFHSSEFINALKTMDLSPLFQ
jgi:CheY-like chemotaxis protein